MRRLTAKQRAKIIEALRRYPNCSAVARQIGGVSHETVRVIAHQSGIALARWKKFSGEEREKIAKALRQNPNPTAVAKWHGNIDDGTVRKIAKEKRIKLSEANLRKGKRLAPKQRALIIKKLKANPTRASWRGKSATSSARGQFKSSPRKRKSVSLRVVAGPREGAGLRPDESVRGWKPDRAETLFRGSVPLHDSPPAPLSRGNARTKRKQRMLLLKSLGMKHDDVAGDDRSRQCAACRRVGRHLERVRRCRDVPSRAPPAMRSRRERNNRGAGGLTGLEAACGRAARQGRRRAATGSDRKGRAVRYVAIISHQAPDIQGRQRRRRPYPDIASML